MKNEHGFKLTTMFQYAKTTLCAGKASIRKRHGRCTSLPRLLLYNEFRGVVDKRREDEMLWTIFVILLVLWLLGVVSSYTVGGFIHLLLVLALVVLLINIIGGRRTVV
jgi:hypothetical protein